MNCLNLLVLILLPISAMTQSCPAFQSVIPLRQSATEDNLSFAVIADGKYYLIGAHNQNRRHLDAIGVMPKGFKDSRLTVLIDRFHCNESEYYLLTLQTIPTTGANDLQTYYSTLDLLKWNPSTKWSEPKPIAEHPMLANDPFLSAMTNWDPNFSITDLIHAMFYWEQTKTMFVVTKPLRHSDPGAMNTSELRYYTIDTQNACEQSYTYSKGSETLKSALHSVIQPMDFCFFNDQKIGSEVLLYCIGKQSFQVNAISPELKNGTLRTELIGPPKEMPPIDRLPIFARMCSKSKPNELMSEMVDFEAGIKVRIDDNFRGPEVDNDLLKPIPELANSGLVPKDDMDDMGPSYPLGPVQHLEPNVVQSPELDSASRPKIEIKDPADDSSYTFIIVLICLAVFIVIFLGILITAARKRNQIARM